MVNTTVIAVGKSHENYFIVININDVFIIGNVCVCLSVASDSNSKSMTHIMYTFRAWIGTQMTVCAPKN